MKKTIIITFIGCLAAAVCAQEQVIAGWDKSFDIGSGRQSADYTAKGVKALAKWDGQNPARIDRGSTDLTFGTFPGAINSTDRVSGATVLYADTELILLVTNNGESPYSVSAFRFDYNRAFPNGPRELEISFSGGLKGPDEKISLRVTGKRLRESIDFKDIDIQLAEFQDSVLAPGEQAVITITTVGGRGTGGIQIDNIALTGE